MKEFDDVSEKTRVTDAVSIKPAESAQDVLVLIYPPGPNLGRKYELKGKLIAIGRDPASDILISSDSVSRRHARLSMEGNRRILTDLESTNGSYVADQPIISKVLTNGDQVKIGDTIFKYLVGSDVEASYHEEIYRMTIIDGLTGVFNKKVFGFLRTCRDEATGGVYYQVNRESGLFESNATACLCLAGLMRGRLEVAKKSADSLLQWKGLQKDERRFYIRWNSFDGLRTECDEADRKFFVVDSTQEAQLYWLIGLPMAALAKLYQVVGERKYLECSIALYDFLVSCRPDVFGSPPIGKLGWGAAVLYRITGDTRYLETNQKITRYYLDTQHKDGYWLAPAYETVEAQPLKQTTDWTSEFCAWLSDYLAELGTS